MEKRKIKKEINKIIKPVCEEYGFKRRGESLIYYKIKDDVLNFIYFQGKTLCIECGIYILPLYILSDSFVLQYGNGIIYTNLCDRNDFFLRQDMDDEDIITNINNHTMFLRKVAFPWFDRIGTPQGIADYALKDNILFTPPVFRNEIKGYSELYLQNYKKAEKYISKYLRMRRKGYGYRGSEDEQREFIFLDKVKNSPTEAYNELLRNVVETKKALKI